METLGLCHSEATVARSVFSVAQDIYLGLAVFGFQCLRGVWSMKAALFVIDVQKEFFKPRYESTKSLNSAIEYINEAIGLFRKKNLPVVVVQHKDEREGLVPSKADFDVPESVKVKPDDMRVVKTYGNSFTKTGLAEKLRGLGVDTVIVTGFSAPDCVLATYRGALDFDFVPIMLRGALACRNAEHIRFVEEITETVTLGALQTLL